jgi:gliding motility-associated-like protein
MVTITVYAKPELSFTPDTTRGCTPFAVTFTDNSVVDPAITVNALTWTFGDGGTGTGSPVTHTYNDNGVFDVGLELEATQANCDVTVNVPDLIDVSSIPNTAFTTTPNPASACEPPLAVSFTNQTTGDGTISYEWDFGNGNTFSGANPPSQTYTTEGNFTVTLTATEDNGCVGTFTRVISIGDPLASFEIPDTVCIRDSILLVNNSAAGFYNWQFGPTATPSFSNIATPWVVFNQEGNVDITLSVTAFDGSCTGDTTITIFVDEADASFVSDPSYSCSEPFEINYTSLSDEPVEWQWVFYDGNTSSASDTSYTFVNLDTTIYGENGQILDTTFLIVTNPSGCRDTAFQIDTIHLPNALFMPDVVDGCAPLTVMFADSSTSNEQIIRYEYDYGDGNTAVFNNDDPHSYTFTDPGEYEVVLNIENEGGCVDTSYAIIIRVGDAIDVDFTVDANEVCPGDTVRFTSLTDPTNIDAWHYKTDDGRSFHCYQESELDWAFVTETGTYDVTLQVEYNGCISEQTIQDAVVVKGPIAKLDYEIDCENPLDVTFSDESYEATTVTWDFGDTTTSNLQDLIHTYDTTGNYWVTLTAENPSTGCAASVDSALVCVRLLEAGFELDTILCVGQTYQLDATLSQDVNADCWKGFNWFFENNSRPITTQDTIIDFVFGQSGDETVTLVVEDINGCFDTTAIDVELFSITSEFELDDNFICTNGTVPVNFTDQSTADTTIVDWMWSFGSTEQNPSHIFTDIVAPGDSIFVTLTVTDEVGCPATSEQFITVYRPISAILASPALNICAGSEVNFNGIDFTAGGSNLEFEWDFGDSNMGTGISVSNTYENEGSFTVTMDYTEVISGCSGQAVTQVNVQDFPEAAFTYDKINEPVICSSDALLMFTDQSTSNFPLSYSWNFDTGGPLSSAQNPSITFDKGVFDVEMTVTTPFGCSDVVSQQIIVVGPEGEISLDDNLICIGESINFELINPVDVENFTWFIQGNTFTDQSPINYQFDDVALAGLNQILVQLELTGNNGQCQTTIDTLIGVQNIVAEFSSPNNICVGFDFPFTNNTVGADTFEWDFGNGDASTDVNPVTIYDEEGIYDVLLTASSNEGCVDTILKAVTIENITGLAMSIDPDPEDVDRYCLRDTVILEATADSDLTGASYQWFVNGIAQEGLDTSVIAVVLEGPDPTIEFEVEVTDNNGCIGSVIREVTFEPCTEVEVPNVFTPNGDGTNDFFNLVSNNNIGSIGDDVEVLEFKIWNRWGSLVYDNDNPTMGWDGTNGGDPAPSEVYVYQIVYRKLPEAEEFVVSGDVTLVR